MCKQIPSRIWITMMIFWGSSMNYMFISHYQISLLAMMAPRKNETVENFGPRFVWTYQWEQQSISALFYGATIVSFPLLADFLIRLFGSWHILFWTTAITAISSDIIVPMSNHAGPAGVFVMRFVVGTMVGLQHPALQRLAHNWTPPKEKVHLTSCLIGNAFGSIITMPLTGLIIEEFGWTWSFYYLTVVAVFFCIALFLLVSDHPRDYRWIRQEELDMIQASPSEGESSSSEREKPPYLSMIVSSSFWAVLAAHFSSQYNFNLTLTTVPQFFKRKMKYSSKTTAGMAALPLLAGLLSSSPYGLIQRWLVKGGFSKAACGTAFTFVPLILSGLTLMYIPKIVDAVYVVWFFVAMMLFNGLALTSILANPQDLTTNWQETIYHTMNFFGNCGGFIGPILVAKLTEENTSEGWGIVFLIGGILNILTGLFFRCFVEYEIQPWNEKNNSENN